MELNTDLQLYWSTGVFYQPTLPETIAFSLEHNIGYIELSSGVKYQPDLLDPVRQTCDTIQYLVHNYFPPPPEPFVLNLASSEVDILRRSLDLCRTAIDLTAELGGAFYSVHSGFAFHLMPDHLGNPVTQAHIPESAYISYDDAYEIFRQSVLILTEYAGSKGTRLLIENNVVSPLFLAEGSNKGLLMASADEIVRLMQDVNDPNLGVLVDTGHVNVTATALGFHPEQFVNSVAPYVGALHLSHNDGQTDQNLPFDETAWFCPFLSDFAHLPLVIEAYQLTWPQMQQQLAVLETIL